jgi:hypothetical protein
MKKILAWLDHNLLTVLTGILIVMIPLYPKIPLADLLEGYIVRLRFEDLAVLCALLIWGIQLLRRRVRFPTGLVTKLILAYLVIGFLSTLSAIWITKTVPFEIHHLAKLYLHYFRRVEYFSLFFIAYSAIKSKRDIIKLIWISGATLVAVVLYGFGQKYLLWPAFSTMNREFSKGARLYLGPGARVMSTFAGHYDYAAYLMMALSIIVAYLMSPKKWWAKLVLIVVGLGAYWSLILTASRTSFIGYLTGITVVALLVGRQIGRIKAFFAWFAVMTVSIVIMLTMGDLSERFYQVLQNPDLLAHDVTQILPIKREWISNPLSLLGPTLGAYGEKLLALRQSATTAKIAAVPDGAVSTDELEKVAARSDTPPSTTRPLPPDVTQAEEDFRKEQEALQNKPSPSPTSGSGYSPNALKYGLSVAIRLDALWPRAEAGFARNPLLGSGYSTLTKSTNEEFTQAESTDNDYLRMLGETGLLGTLAFLAIPLATMYYAYLLYRQTDDKALKYLSLGMIGAIVSLLVNATYIDIFESSKIAYVLWIMTALIVRAYELKDRNEPAPRA